MTLPRFPDLIRAGPALLGALWLSFKGANTGSCPHSVPRSWAGKVFREGFAPYTTNAQLCYMDHRFSSGLKFWAQGNQSVLRGVLGMVRRA